MERSSPDQALGLYETCPECKSVILIDDLIANTWVCTKPKCGHHLLITARQRLQILAEPDSFEEWDDHLRPMNPIDFPGYAQKIEETIRRTGMYSAAITGSIQIGEFKVAIGITDYSFMAGAMNSVVGERLARCLERATQEQLPVILVSGSGGGAMMHEGLKSLMQMPIVTGALSRHKQAGLLSICLLTDATFGGVIASWASLAQVTLAEPKARIGFVGDRVSGLGLGLLELPPVGFRTAAYQQEHGAIDRIIVRTCLKETLLTILRCSPQREKLVWEEGAAIAEAIRTKLPKAEEDFLHDQSGSSQVMALAPTDNLTLARHTHRAHSLDYIGFVFDHFFELHGDRCLRDDGAIVGGLADIEGLGVVVLGHQKNRDMTEKKLRNYGMAGSAGYRKAVRLMRLAEQRNCPLVCLIDTPGADITVDSENHGISYALAECQETLLNLTVPVVSVIIGEGGSGGAVALGVANELLILEHAVYSVIAPEGCASIVWKDKTKVAEAAKALKITAGDAFRLGIADRVVSEPREGAHVDFSMAGRILKAEIAESLARLCGRSNLKEERYQRFRKVNTFLGK